MADVPHVITVAPGLHRIDTPLGDRYASLYLAEGDDSVVLYDTGIDGTIPTHVLPALTSLDRTPADVSAVIISHCDVDHFGGAADARESFPNARLLAGAADRPLIENFERYLDERARGFVDAYGWDEDPAVLEWCRSVTRETRLDASASDGDRFDLGGGRTVEVIELPGHSHGHLGLDVGWADAVLVGDAVLAASVDLADGTPAFPPTYRFVDEYLATVARLEALDRDLLLTAHYPVMRGDDVRAFLARSRGFADRLDALVKGALSGIEGLTFAELLGTLNPIAGEWPVEGTAGALAFPVAGHLERQIAQGSARTVGRRAGVALWSAS